MMQPFAAKKIIASRTSLVTGGGGSQEGAGPAVEDPTEGVVAKMPPDEIIVEHRGAFSRAARSGSSDRLDALFAAAREEFDLDVSPVDQAVRTLKSVSLSFFVSICSQNDPYYYKLSINWKLIIKIKINNKNKIKNYYKKIIKNIF
jgi:hypothetical protein